jgi:hypothetical protein
MSLEKKFESINDERPKTYSIRVNPHAMKKEEKLTLLALGWKPTGADREGDITFSFKAKGNDKPFVPDSINLLSEIQEVEIIPFENMNLTGEEIEEIKNKAIEAEERLENAIRSGEL